MYFKEALTNIGDGETNVPTSADDVPTLEQLRA